MNKLGRRLAVMGLCACMGAASLTGCSNNPANITVATLDGESIKQDLYTFMLRYNQLEFLAGPYASMLGEDVFNTDLAGDGTTYGETFKTSVLENLEMLLLLEKHAPEYDVTLTDDEKAGITKAAEEFIAANDEKALKEICGTQEVVERVLSLYQIQMKMRDAIYAQVDTEVSDEEAAQKTINYVYLSTAGTEKDEEGNTIDLTDEQKAEIKEKAQKILDGAKESGDLEAAAKEVDESLSMLSSSYGKDSGNLKEEITTVADTLEDGQVADEPVETETGYYAIQMKTTFDEEATATRKEAIIQERKSDKYSEVTTAWKEEAEFEVKDKALGKIDFFDNYKPKQAETEAGTAPEGATEAVTETTTGETETAGTEEKTEAAGTEGTEEETEAAKTAETEK